MSHYTDTAYNRERPICPKCKGVAKETTTRYGLRNQCCDLWSWDRFPLADAKTHEARKAAHAAFDKLWKGKGKVMKRGQAYGALRRELGLTGDECHIKLMDAETAGRVPKAAKRIREKEISARMMSA